MNQSRKESINIAGSQHIKEKNYWMRKMSGELNKSYFPYDNVTTENSVNNMKAIDFDIEDTLFIEITKISSGSSIKEYLVLMTGIVVLLSKYTGYENIVIGTPILKQEIEKQFINTVLPIRNDIDKASTFKNILLRLKQTVVEAIENQNYPIETLAYQLGLELSEDKCTLFDVVLLMENIHDRKYIEHIQPNIIFLFNNTGKSISGRVEYNGFLYNEDTIKLIIKHLRLLLMKMFADINKEVCSLSLLSEEETKQVLFDFNNTYVQFPEDITINDLFEEQVRKSKDNIAIEFNGDSLTYVELNRKANSLAEVLIEKTEVISQKESNIIIAIMAERSLEMIVGMLAILKAGGAYLPIDPEYPTERIKYMLEDSNVKILLTQKNALKKTIDFNGNILCLEDESLYTPKSKNTLRKVDPSNIAYIIYTSGSTGNPKGVLIEHRNITNTLLWRKSYYSFNEKVTVLQIPSFCFDSSVEDIFTPLISGSKLVLLQQGNRLNLNYLKQTITSNGISHFLITPGLYKTILENIPECLYILKSVTLAGEGFTNDLVNEHFEKLNLTRLYNEYGPTENSVCSTVYEFNKNNMKILIGKPISNVKCYILDKYNNLCPINVAGELCVSGSGVGKGYLNKPQLTEERFISNPFEKGLRIYKTGDMAKWLPDGNIEFLGRKDCQVKLRGYRVELGEVENQIVKCGMIKDCVVTIIERCDKSKALCAYIVCEDGLSIASLKNFLTQTLPEYMIPEYLIKLNKVPLTINGKVDKKALPDPEKAAEKQPYEAPTSEVELKLVRIWNDIFGSERQIGVNDDFFKIGGQSLKAATLANKVLKDFNVEITLMTIFSKPTIKQLAQHIENYLKCKSKRSNIEEINIFNDCFIKLSEDKEDNIFCFPDVIGLGIMYKKLASILDNHTVYAFNYMNEDTKINLYADIIEKIQPDGQFKLLGYSAGGALAFEVVKELEARGRQVAKLILIDSYSKGRVIQITNSELVNFDLRISQQIKKQDWEDSFAKVPLDRAKLFYIYYMNLKTQGKIKSDICLITSKDRSEDSDFSGWECMTEKTYMIYNGYGAHLEMLSYQYINKNTEIIKEILQI